VFRAATKKLELEVSWDISFLWPSVIIPFAEHSAPKAVSISPTYFEPCGKQVDSDANF
jgi:hypothetical protein